jgi:hypothetical protein
VVERTKYATPPEKVLKRPHPGKGCNLGATPAGVGTMFGKKPVVATASRSYHRLRFFHPFGMADGLRLFKPKMH